MEVKVYLPSTSFTPAPITLSFPPETPAKEVVLELSKKFHTQGEEGSLVITPTSATTGGVVDPRTCVKSFNLDIEERLELWRAPYLINILLVSDFTSADPVKQRKEIVFDYGSPLSYSIPLLRRIFSLQDEFVFQYIPSLDDDDKVKWLDSRKSLSDQSFEGTAWLMCYPINTLLKAKDASQRFTEVTKEGYLIKQTQRGSKKTPKRRRWAVLKDQFLFYFKNKGDTIAAGIVPLEYYTLSMVQIKQMPSLHLKRAIGRFDNGHPDLYIIYGDEGDDLTKWKEVLQRKCLGTGSIFGVTLEEMSKRPSAKPFVPDIVVTLTEYMIESGLHAEGILRISGSNAVVQFHKDQFDRGMAVTLSARQDVHVIASLLKLYFRELPDPAIPFMFYEEIMSIMNMQGPDKKTDVLPLLLEVISKLPDSHFYVLRHMCQFLFAVALHSAANLMDIPNLGTVMGPNLLRPPDHKLASFVQDSPSISECIQLLIQNHEQIYKSEFTPRTQLRRAPMMSEEELKQLGDSKLDAKVKWPSKLNYKGKERSDKFELMLKGALSGDQKSSPAPPLASPKNPPPPASFVMESVILAQQNVHQELQQHLATNPPQPPPSLLTSPTPPSPTLSTLSPTPARALVSSPSATDVMTSSTPPAPNRPLPPQPSSLSPTATQRPSPPTQPSSLSPTAPRPSQSQPPALSPTTPSRPPPPTTDPRPSQLPTTLSPTTPSRPPPPPPTTDPRSPQPSSLSLAPDPRPTPPPTAPRPSPDSRPSSKSPERSLSPRRGPTPPPRLSPSDAKKVAVSPALPQNPSPQSKADEPSEDAKAARNVNPPIRPAGEPAENAKFLRNPSASLLPTAGEIGENAKLEISPAPDPDTKNPKPGTTLLTSKMVSKLALVKSDQAKLPVSELTKDAQPAKDSVKVEPKSGSDHNQPLSPRRLELTTTFPRILPPTFPSKTKNLPLPPSSRPPPPHPPPPTPTPSSPPPALPPPPPPTRAATSSGADDGDTTGRDERVEKLEEECKNLRQRVEEETFKRKLLELKLELLLHRMNEMETKLLGRPTNEIAEPTSDDVEN